MKQSQNFDFGDLLARVASFAARRARAVIAVAVVASLVAAALATQLDPSAATDTLVGRDGPAFKATEQFHKDFGDDPIVVLAKGKPKTPNALGAMVLTKDIGQLLKLEGCLSGNIPKGAKPPAPVCAKFAKTRPVKVVYGPGTFINEAASQISGQFEAEGNKRKRQADRAALAARKVAEAQGLSSEEQAKLAKQARQLVYLQFARDAAQLALKYGLKSVPSLNNPDFVLQLVFEPSLGAGVPKPRFSYVFPSSNSALIQARLKPGLSAAEKERAVEMVREAVENPAFKLKFGEYIVSGVPVVAQGVESSVAGQLSVLLVVAVFLMALALLAVFRSSKRLLPLALSLAAAALTFGAMFVLGVALTIAAIAVLPILIGLAVDYSIQSQSRFNEEQGPPPEAAATAARKGGPVIATAAAATAVGFLVLLLSPVPMVRSFGLLLVLGIVLALIVALVVGSAALGGNLAAPERLRSLVAKLPRKLPALVAALIAIVVLALLLSLAQLATLVAIIAVSALLLYIGRRLLAGNFDRVTSLGTRRPGRVLLIAAALAVLGWGLGTQVETVSDLTRLVPASQREVKDLRTLERETGVSGDIDVIVHSDKLTSPKVLRWIADYQKRVLGRHGYQEGRPCKQSEICPALSLTNLFTAGAGNPKQINALLDALPPYFSQAVVTPDRKTTNVAFGIRVMPLEDQKRLVDDMRAQLDPPPGVTAEVAGLPVLAADANENLSTSRWVVTGAGLLAVLIVLLLVYRRLERALVPLVPVVLATGWAGLALFISRIPLNPMSATLGALVIAISTEFSVILSARYRREREAGLDPRAALARTYERTGAAVLASGITATAGFAALVASDFRMLRDFGLATVIDLAVSLLGVMIVLPAAMIWAERRAAAKAPVGSDSG